MFDTTNSSEKNIKELEIRNNKLDRDIKEFLEEINVTPEQLTKFCSESENFNEENWKELKNIQSTMDKELEVRIKSAHNPRETKKKLKEQIVDNRWIYVR